MQIWLNQAKIMQLMQMLKITSDENIDIRYIVMKCADKVQEYAKLKDSAPDMAAYPNMQKEKAFELLDLLADIVPDQDFPAVDKGDSFQVACNPHNVLQLVIMRVKSFYIEITNNKTRGVRGNSKSVAKFEKSLDTLREFFAV